MSGLQDPRHTPTPQNVEQGIQPSNQIGDTGRGGEAHDGQESDFYTDFFNSPEDLENLLAGIGDPGGPHMDFGSFNGYP